MQSTDQQVFGGPLVWRARKPDEWEEDYLLTLIRMHGVVDPISSDLDLIRRHHTGSSSPESLEAILNKDGGWRADVSRPRYGAVPFPRWCSVSRGKAIRYCPVCYSQDRYIRGRWRLTSLLVCSLHGCYLKEGLKDPVLTLTRKGERVLNRENATDEALLAESICCLRNEREIVSAIWGPFERAAQACTDPAQDNALGELLAWTLLTWRVVESVALAHVKIVQRVQSIGRLPSMVRLFDEIGLTVSPDREGVRRFLLSLRHNVHYMTAQSVFRHLLAAEKVRRTLMGQLPLHELEELCAAAAPRPGGRATPGEVAFPVEMARGMSRVQAIAALGASEALIDEWMRNGCLPRVWVRRVGQKPLLFIDRTDVHRLRRRLASLIYVEDFIAEHGIDGPTYYGLRSGGFLDPVILRGRRYVFRPQLSSLISQLELVCSPKPVNLSVDLPVFGQPTRGLCEMLDAYASLVRAAVTGTFPVYRDLDRVGLAAFRVGKEALCWLQVEKQRARLRARQASSLQTGQLELLEA